MATTAATTVPPRPPLVRRLLLAGSPRRAGVLRLGRDVQMLTREGFDITRHPISQLATGGLGWIQITTFVLAGLGALAWPAASGARSPRGSADGRCRSSSGSSVPG